MQDVATEFGSIAAIIISDQHLSDIEIMSEIYVMPCADPEFFVRGGPR